MTTNKTSLPIVAALMVALWAGSTAAQQQPDPDCKLPASLRLKTTSTVVYECGHGIPADAVNHSRLHPHHDQSSGEQSCDSTAVDRSRQPGQAQP